MEESRRGKGARTPDPEGEPAATSSEGSTARGFSEALLLAAAPVVAYLVAFVYQAGRASYLGYPVALVELSLSRVFIAAAALLVFGSLFWHVARLIYAMRRVRQRRTRWPRTPLGRRLYVTLGVLSLCVPVALLFGFTRPESLWALAILGGTAAIYLIPELLVPLVTGRGKPYGEKLKQIEAAQRVDPELDLLALQALERRVGVGGTFLVILLVLTVIAAYLLGRSNAIRQEEFYVAEVGGKEYVVLDQYGDKLITAGLLRPCDYATPEVVIVPLGSALVTLSKENLGPLVRGQSCTEEAEEA